MHELVCECKQERWTSQWVVWSPGMITVPCSSVPKVATRTLLGFREGTCMGQFVCAHAESLNVPEEHPIFLCQWHWLTGYINPAFLIQLESCNTKNNTIRLHEGNPCLVASHRPSYCSLIWELCMQHDVLGLSPCMNYPGYFVCFSTVLPELMPLGEIAWKNEAWKPVLLLL